MRAAFAIGLVVVTIVVAGCGKSQDHESATVRFEQQVGTLCSTLASQIRSVVARAAFSGEAPNVSSLPGKLGPKIRAEVERELTTDRVASYLAAARGSAAVLSATLAELRKVPTPNATAAVKAGLESALLEATSRVESLERAGNQAAERSLAKRLGRLMAGARQYSACRAGIATLEREPLLRAP
ncbi:MAG TPA: hypothetical protein VGH09_00310 [Solirubrobacteraceae bacterium]|jgi:hypothetical protein